MSDHPNPPLSEAAQAVADSKIPPGDDYEEIREQVRKEVDVFPGQGRFCFSRIGSFLFSLGGC